MYDALRLFHTHVQQTAALMLGVITTVFAVFGFALQRTDGHQSQSIHVINLGAIILLLMAPVAALSVNIIGRYYYLYVSALYFAAVTARNTTDPEHPWLAEVPLDAHERDAWIRRRTFGRGHSLFLYSLLLWLLGGVGLIGSAILFFGF